jgi:threonine/homoserine/homoserine lactone efflux protein
MIRFVILGSVLGIVSGLVPGPFTALIAATALERGFRIALWIAVVPLVSETGVMILTALLLSRVPDQALRWMGVLGGVLVFYLAYRTWLESRSPPRAEPLTGSGRRMLEGSLLAVLSPAPWVFWLLVGGPLVLAAWRRGWATAAAFAASFLLFLVGIHLGVAAAAAFGRRELTPGWYRRIMVAVTVVLLIAGGMLVWQSWIGNFHEMVTGSQTVRDMMDETVR